MSQVISSADAHSHLPFTPDPVLGKSWSHQQHHSMESFHFVTLRSGKSSLYQENVLSVTQFTKQQVRTYIAPYVELVVIWYHL
jgi:hypothetical protein